MNRLVFATHNEGKLKEMNVMLQDLGVEVVSAKEAGVHEEPEENGSTFAQNALIKARFVAARTGEWAVADDSGVTIEALGGWPGIYSGRWIGDGGYEEIVNGTLEKMKAIPPGKRTAVFYSVAALVSP